MGHYDNFESLDDLAYFYHSRDDIDAKSALEKAIWQIVRFGEEEEKQRFLGMDNYLDILTYHKKLDNRDVDCFIPTFDKYSPSSRDSTIYSKRRIIDWSLSDEEHSQIIRALFISEKLFENFSSERLEEYFNFRDSEEI